ncbi:ADP-ribosylglycohydrolase-related protein [Chlamydiales bacterium STE3]|nr:ADP-ribosylglycohydrolase-related protein [Chlamydiales bacterium STE3]
MISEERLTAAIWGQLIGDAIALGSHWIYQPELLRLEYPEGLKGFEMPKKGHYHYGKVSGDSTHYGEGCRLMLQSIAEKREFSKKDFTHRFQSFFGSSLQTGYIDHATRETLRNIHAKIEPSGADDDQMATATRLAPLVAFYCEKANLQDFVKQATQIGQNHHKSLAYMECNASILADLMKGVDLRTAFKKQVSHSICGPKIESALIQEKGDLYEITQQFGISCGLDEAFPCSIYIALAFDGHFEKALLANVQAGGDSAGRGGLLGSWLGAYQGIAAIPQNWMMKLRGKELIQYWINELIRSSNIETQPSIA